MVAVHLATGCCCQGSSLKRTSERSCVISRPGGLKTDDDWTENLNCLALEWKTPGVYIRGIPYHINHIPLKALTFCWLQKSPVSIPEILLDENSAGGFRNASHERFGDPVLGGSGSQWMIQWLVTIVIVVIP